MEESVCSAVDDGFPEETFRVVLLRATLRTGLVDSASGSGSVSLALVDGVVCSDSLMVNESWMINLSLQQSAEVVDLFE